MLISGFLTLKRVGHSSVFFTLISIRKFLKSISDHDHQILRMHQRPCILKARNTTKVTHGFAALDWSVDTNIQVIVYLQFTKGQATLKQHWSGQYRTL